MLDRPCDGQDLTHIVHKRRAKVVCVRRDGAPPVPLDRVSLLNRLAPVG